MWLIKSNNKYFKTTGELTENKNNAFKFATLESAQDWVKVIQKSVFLKVDNPRIIIDTEDFDVNVLEDEDE